MLGKSFLKRISVSLAAVTVVSGCADIVTFSKQSHDEGVKLYGEKDYADAAGAFNNAVRQVPNDYADYYYLAECYTKLGQYQQAIQSYRAGYQIMQVDAFGKQDTKVHDLTLIGWANAVARCDSPDAQINSIEATAHEKQTADYYLLLAKIDANRGDADSAMTAYNRALMQDPQNFGTAKEFGLYLERIGQADKAAMPLKQAYALNGNDPQVTAALRRIGIIPGPSIKDANALAKPLIPAGPLPELIPTPGESVPTAMPAASRQPPQD